jgi:hypothetical protein
VDNFLFHPPLHLNSPPKSFLSLVVDTNPIPTFQLTTPSSQWATPFSTRNMAAPVSNGSPASTPNTTRLRNSAAPVSSARSVGHATWTVEPPRWSY